MHGSKRDAAILLPSPPYSGARGTIRSGLLFFGRRFLLSFRRFRFLVRRGLLIVGGLVGVGINGSAIISHGRSNAKAIKNAIRVAKSAVEGDILTVFRGVGAGAE